MKPIAYIDRVSGKPKLIDAYVVQTPVDIPLYTHPVKELTDEEIHQIFQFETGFYFDDSPADSIAIMDFARAILRKANEK